jgi:hypothetical protein
MYMATPPVLEAEDVELVVDAVAVVVPVMPVDITVVGRSAVLVEIKVVLLDMAVDIMPVELYLPVVMFAVADELSIYVGSVVTTSCVYVVKPPLLLAIVTVSLYVVTLGLGDESTKEVWMLAGTLPEAMLLPLGLPPLHELSK